MKLLRTVTLILLICSISGFKMANAQSIIASGVLSGNQITTAPGVTFPTVPPIPNGSSIDFLAGGVNDVLINLPLLNAGSVGSLDDVDVHLLINLTQLSGDNDPYFFITDGNESVVAGIVGSEGNGGQSIEAAGTMNPTRVFPNFLTGFARPCNCIPPVNTGSITLDFTISISSGMLTVNGTISGTGGGIVLPYSYNSYTQVLDPSSGLKFIFARDDQTFEGYRINNFEYEIIQNTATPIPTVSEWALIFLGISFCIGGAWYVSRLI